MPAADNPTTRVARPRAPRAGHATVMVFVGAAAGVLQFWRPAHSLETRPFARLNAVALPGAAPSANAFGRSGEVKVRFALPGARVEYPLELGGNPDSLRYVWVGVDDSVPADSALPLAGSEVVAPARAGFYRLALERGGQREIVDGLTLAVLVPFKEKVGAMLNGYRIGTYLAERIGGSHAHPEGFVEVTPQTVDMPLSTHLRLADFVTHDDQDVWPRYAALNGQLLDKLELVIAELRRARGGEEPVQLTVQVHSGFRAPAHNRNVRQAAKDSRHQYGDAADVAIDANGDGRISRSDVRLIVRAVEAVETAHPELVGGLGLYREPYVHIDTRGTRARWRS